MVVDEPPGNECGKLIDVPLKRYIELEVDVAVR
jgi:hypothetical protein